MDKNAGSVLNSA